MRQLQFAFGNDYQKEFGGNCQIGRRKTARPISVKHPMHLVLKTTKMNPFNPTNRNIERIIKGHAVRFGITLYNFAVNGSHIHMVIKLSLRESYFAFIKTVTAALVSYLSKALSKDLSGLLNLRPYTRILTWGKQFRIALEYMELNQQEALGLIKRVKKLVRSRVSAKL